MESIIRAVIMEDFFNKGFFSDNQYGFIKGRSTVLQLLKIFDDWTYKMDQGVQIDVIYTDFEKAFDKVPHLGLISKLKAYHIDQIVTTAVTTQYIKEADQIVTLPSRNRLTNVSP